MPHKDPEARKAFHRAWSAKNKDRVRANGKRQGEKKRLWFIAFKSKLSCKYCGESCWACLDFHHRDPTQKKYNLSLGVVDGWSAGRLEEEAAKCDVLCSNCHRKLHRGLLVVDDKRITITPNQKPGEWRNDGAEEKD